MAGISSRQGTHQVAQKLRKTVFPRKFFSETFFPSGLSTEKSGVGPTSLIGWSVGMTLKLMPDCASAEFSRIAHHETTDSRTRKTGLSLICTEIYRSHFRIATAPNATGSLRRMADSRSPQP